jgi:hypothetical protein
MLVALAVSSIIIIASYASYDLVATQYRKHLDIADMHTSGRAIMRIIERDMRMAGFEYRDKDAKVTYGTISSPLIIKDSGNKCCDEVTVIYDYHDEDTKKAERIRIKYWTEPHISNKGARHRLFKQKDILGQNKKILAKPILGKKDVMADYIEDLQIVNIINDGLLYSGFHQTNNGIDVYDIKNNKSLGGFSFGTISALAFGSDGLLYSGHEGNNHLGIYNVDSKKYIGSFNANTRVSALALGSDGILYSGFHQVNGGIDMHDVKNKKYLGSFGSGSISALAFGPDGLLYSGHEGGYYVGIYDTYAKKNIGGFSVRERVSALAFDSNSLLYIGHKGSRGVYVYNIDNKKLIQYLGKIGSDTVSTLAFGSDGLLYSGSEGSSYIVSHNVKTKKTEAYMRTNNSNRVSALAFKDSKTGQESLITINLTLRTKNQYGKDRQFKKKDYHGGNFKIDKTDKYKRDTFSSTVLIRNLAL